MHAASERAAQECASASEDSASKEFNARAGVPPQRRFTARQKMRVRFQRDSLKFSSFKQREMSGNTSASARGIDVRGRQRCGSGDARACFTPQRVSRARRAI